LRAPGDLRRAPVAVLPVASELLSFAAVVDRCAYRSPQKVAAVDGERRVTTLELSDRVNALAAALSGRGVAKGDVVALLLFNGLPFLETTLAINRIGAVFLPLNWRLAADEWAYILEHSGASAIVADVDFGAAVEPLVARLPALSVRIAVGGELGTEWLEYDALCRSHAGEHVPCSDVGPDDLQRLMYTSGTTSRPKGVAISYSNLFWKNVAQVLQFGLTHEDVTLIAGPMYHVGGFDLPATSVMFAGGRVVILRRFDADEVLRCVERERVTNVWLAPAMLSSVLRAPELGSRDISTLRLIVAGGEKMPAAVMERACRAFPRTWLADCYGLTETVSGDTVLDREFAGSKLGSVGRAVPGLQLRVVNEQGTDVLAGDLGEVVLRGPKVFAGYWRDEVATAQAIRGGWFYTGDVGRLDDEGFLYIEDRKKDMITSGGENIATPEIERVLYEHEAVLEAAVVGIPHERWGEVPMAFVVLRPELGATGDDLVAFCRERLAPFKVPVGVSFLEALPRTASGKVLKRQLRDAWGCEQIR
jgi:acyl-CoA synthetase (AMP-forming)/AMP-acid ligase II